jgi:hypothetical protein
MAKPHYNDPTYRAARAWLTAHPGTPCWKNCGRPATTIDHVPAIMHHTHVRGAGCCQLKPACRRCNCSHGASEGNRRRDPHTERW